jgi:hypothetical protein
MATVLGGAIDLSPASAQAAKPEPESLYIEIPMVRIGVDYAIAKANGYEARVDANGIEYAAKKGEATITDTVPGNCGTSFIYFTAVDKVKHYTTVYTGYNIRNDWPGAIVTYWRINITDRFGSSSPSEGDTHGPTSFWSWGYGFTSGGA